MPRGRKKNYKGGHRHFTDPNEIKAREDKERKEKEWRKMQGIESSDSEGEGGEKKEKEDSATGGAYVERTIAATGAAGTLPPSDSESESESDEEVKPKGLSHLIDIENPNRVLQKNKKVSELESGDGKPQLTRKQREEIQKQQAKANYMKAHLAGKTEEAQADMARLALIRKQREEAAAKKAVEKSAADEKKREAEKKLLDKRAGKK